jgi:hypothetical protein
MEEILEAFVNATDNQIASRNQLQNSFSGPFKPFKPNQVKSSSFFFGSIESINKIIKTVRSCFMKTTLDKQTSLQEQMSYSAFLKFVLLAYVTQGIAQHFCLVSQPLEYCMLKIMHFNAAKVAALLSFLMVPWMIKPVFGILSDALPLAGFRRKSYLALFYGVAGFCYVGAATAHSLNWLMAALFMTGLGMAAGTVIICGLTLEVGRPTGETRKFQAIQAVGYYGANIVSFIAGGYLCGHLEPGAALSTAAAIASLPCFITAAASWFLLEEQRSITREPLLKGLTAKFTRPKVKSLFLVALFMCCWSFSPGFGTPLYFHQTNDLAFSQIFIGQLGAMLSFGMILGAFFFRHSMDKKMSTHKQARVAVMFGTISTLGYLFLGSPASAVALEVSRGFAEMIAILLVYGLAADVSPKDFESTTIAVLIAAYNIATQLGINIGANLYSYVFNDDFSLLIIVSALATSACWFLIPLLPERDQHLEVSK